MSASTGTRKETMEQIEKLEKRVDKIEENNILEQIAGFKPILQALNENVKKISENSIEKARVEKLENKVEQLENELQNETSKKEAKLFEEIIKYIILAIVGVAVGYFIK